MSLYNCPQCGRVHLAKGLCKQCFEKQESIYWEMSNYLRDHPGSTAKDVAEGTGISLQSILGFLREGHVQLAHEDRHKAADSKESNRK